jgi:hypothetical protein
MKRHGTKKKHRLGLKDQRESWMNYFTVQIPYTTKGRTEWHPDASTGPMSVLTRGNFKTAKAARAWAKKHLGKTSFGVVNIKG